MIISFLLNKISMERKDLPQTPPKIETKNNLKITQITEQPISFLTNEQALCFDFSYNVGYEPNVAEINLRGNVLFLTDEAKRKEILEKWQKEKKLNVAISQHIINFILTKCNVRVLQWAQELNLPPHIPFPRITKTAETKEAKQQPKHAAESI